MQSFGSQNLAKNGQNTGQKFVIESVFYKCQLLTNKTRLNFAKNHLKTAFYEFNRRPHNADTPLFYLRYNLYFYFYRP